MGEEVVQPTQGALGANPSGVGTVMFTDKSPLDILHENLSAADNYAKEIRQNEATAKNRSAKFLADIDPDTKGILDSDAPYFQKKTQGLYDMVEKAMQYGDPSDPKNPMYWDIAREQSDIETQVHASAGQKANLLEQQGKMNPQKDDSESFQNWLTAQRTAANPLDRAKLPINGLVAKTPALDDIMGKIAKGSPFNKMVNQVSPADISKGHFFQTETAENFTDGMAHQVAHNIAMGNYADSKKALDNAWANEAEYNPSVTQTLFGKYKANGEDDTTAAMHAKEEYAYNTFKDQYHQYSSKVKFLGETPDEKVAIKKAGQENALAAQGEWLLTNTKQIFDSDSPYNHNIRYQSVANPKAEPINIYGSNSLSVKKGMQDYVVPVLDKDNLLVKDQNGKPVVETKHNAILATGRLSNGEMVMVTSESQDRAKQSGKTTDEFIQIHDANDYIDKVKYLFGGKLPAAVDAAARANGVLTDNGVNIDKYGNKVSPAGQQAAQQNKNSQYAVQKLTPASTAATPSVPTKLTGKVNPAELKSGNEYDVNGKIYTWNGKNLQPK